MFGHPALLLLARLKLRGSVRKQVRRLRTLKGVVTTLLGVGLMVLWAFLLVGGSLLHDEAAPAPQQLQGIILVACFFMTLMTVFGALSHRGLYLPPEEIERLFSAPVGRPDLVRYRLLAHLGRSLVAVPFVALLVMLRVPHPVFGFLGVMAGMCTLALLGQAISILAGSLEKRLIKLLTLPRTLVIVLAVAGITLPTLYLTTGLEGSGLGGALQSLLPGSNLEGFLELPLVSAVLAPFRPWARATTASGLDEFAPWFGLCALIWVVLFEVTARLPIDFRELSLETSANVAERIRRSRRVGGGASAARISRRTVGWRVPWLFGRGPMGALAWRKTCGIVRKARGTLVVSALVLAFLTILASTSLDGDSEQEVVGGALMIAVLGTLYLCSGLKFDFRDDLDRMDDIKAWPLPPTRLFAAMLLPEVLLVSLLLVAGIVVRAVVTGGWHPLLIGVAAVLPFVVLAWVALDNAVFLFAPVRFVPGQDGTLQNFGRTMVMMLLRLLLLLVVSATVASVGALAWFVGSELAGLEGTPLVLLVGGSGLAVLAVADALLLLLGGQMFRRFDVARDRG